MTVKCMFGNHDAPARWQVQLRIWAHATAAPQRTKKNGALLVTSVCVCDECREKVKAIDFLLPEGRERIASGFSRAGAMPPDFNSAVLEFAEIIDRPRDMLKEAEQSRLLGGKVIEA